MKKLLISAAAILLALCAAAGLMYAVNSDQPAQQAGSLTEPAVVETAAPPEPAPPPDVTPEPAPAPAPTPTPTPAPTPAPEHVQEYNGWPAIPPDQLPQPDKPSGGTEIIIPSNSQIGNYNGTTVFITPDTHTVTDQSNPDYLAEEIFLLTNQERSSRGLKELSYAYGLQEAADTRARECSVLFSHTRPDGTSCHDIVEADYYVTGENLIMADMPIASAENLMAEWMGSEGHRYNILLKDFTSMAVGTYRSSGVVYAVQIFIG